MVGSRESKLKVIREPILSQNTGVLPAGRSLPERALNARIATASGLPSLMSEILEFPPVDTGGVVFGLFAGPVCPGKMPKAPATVPHGFSVWPIAVLCIKTAGEPLYPPTSFLNLI
jgi:hypothetical protein